MGNGGWDIFLANGCRGLCMRGFWEMGALDGGLLIGTQQVR